MTDPASPGKPTRTEQMNTGIHVGTTVDPAGFDALTKAILAILASPGEQKTIRHAIDALSKMAAVTDLSIGNVTISEGGFHHEELKELLIRALRSRAGPGCSDSMTDDPDGEDE